MQQRQIVSGFSEIKDLLIRKYKITEDREKLRLYFTYNDGLLTVHNYRSHEQQIILTDRTFSGVINHMLPKNSFSRQVVKLALNETRPDDFLNSQFKLHGFFRF